MTRRIIGLMIMFAGSLLLGILAGSWFFRLFRHTVPPAVLTSFNQATAHGAFLGYGLLAGVALFVWTLLAVGIDRLFRRS